MKEVSYVLELNILLQYDLNECLTLNPVTQAR